MNFSVSAVIFVSGFGTWKADSDYEEGHPSNGKQNQGGAGGGIGRGFVL